ncbi:hypothetical protein [Litoreibacter arenae]|uniref:Uncharacterized protein n=1 Tax=Litoreibacter arenae DSM 19593 TaxID=1123360 RepID=S9QK56_9RHOB|nr:hypothetical protein [Litoreibacter arenae]EPX80147.1 hypothetical protein thalar_01485 [Litoreibacter arenae DSM 19593]
MTTLSQHLNGLLPLPLKPAAPQVTDRTQVPEQRLMAPPVSQARVDPVAPAAVSAAALFPPDQIPPAPLRDREQHELQALLRNMQGIEQPPPKGERVDLLVPRPTDAA